MQLLLIANPIAGQNSPDLIERARRTFTRLGARVELYLTRATGDAEDRARQSRDQKFDRVIAAGGDGTLNEVVNGLAGSSVPLGFIPFGTTNVFALETGIAFEVEEAAHLAYNGTPRPVTLGKANDRYFLLMAGVGFDGQIVASVSPRIKKLLGKGAYMLTALQQFLLHPPKFFELQIDNRTFRATGLLAANARNYAGRFTLTPGAHLETTSLEISALLREGRFALLRQALCLLAGRQLPAGLGLTESCDTVRIDTPGIAVQVDGDYLGTTPMGITSEPHALQLVYPEKYANTRENK